MKNQSKPIFSSWFLIFLFLFLHQSPVTPQEVEDEREFDYLKESERGPEHWGELKKEWAACKHGKLQSPIDLWNKRVKVIPKLGDIKTNYRPSNATIKNRGHDIAIQWLDDAGSIQINGTDYLLRQCHWHSPSEHSIKGKKFDLELHMLHESQDVNAKHSIAVVAVLYKIGRPNHFLSKLTEDINFITDTTEEIHRGVMDPRDFKMKINPREFKLRGLKFYRYIGSLTVPPCTEGVIWTINRKIDTVSKEQVNLLRIAVHDFAEMNARPLQPLNQREIHLHGPRSPQGNLRN
ncbi:alpha carbonic anhydrase 7 [Ziziphus jujuba]|uniref:Carbonic anhydrase n=1 Tax=Ziziphus jujuba TaxID=326968 RepID=A0A6P4BHE3_ZIZJJ|nr:alpha carbonic anhydrase 7 [Ziziphus jujuba]